MAPGNLLPLPRAEDCPARTRPGGAWPHDERQPEDAPGRSSRKNSKIAEAWALKEAFRRFYRLPDRHQAERRLAAVERAQLPAFAAFADGVRLWRAELLTCIDEPTTNGYAEGV